MIMNILSLQRHIAIKYLNDKLSGKSVPGHTISFIDIEFNRRINQLVKDNLASTENTDSEYK